MSQDIVDEVSALVGEGLVPVLVVIFIDETLAEACEKLAESEVFKNETTDDEKTNASCEIFSFRTAAALTS